MPEILLGVGEGLSNPQLCCVYFANRGREVKLYQAADHARCKIRAVGIVANILGQHFFATVWSREARLDGYLTHKRTPYLQLNY
jgi:ABC-type transport system involved in cytochrome c biogenesis permease subunit